MTRAALGNALAILRAENGEQVEPIACSTALARPSLHRDVSSSDSLQPAPLMERELVPFPEVVIPDES